MSVFKSQSPLQNTLILELIGSYLPSVDLLACVKVCQLWSVEMMRVLKSRRVLDVNFRMPDAVKKVKECISKNSRHRRTVSYHRINVIGQLPVEDAFFKEIFSKWGFLLIEVSIKGFSSTWTAPAFYELLKEFAPNLENLSIHLRDDPNQILNIPRTEQRTSSLLRGLKNINAEFKYPRLKRLKWNIIQSGHSFHEEMMDMCYVFPSLTVIIITTIDEYMGNESNLFFEQKCSEKIFWQSLKTLIYRTNELYSTPFDKFRNLKLNLESFSLIFKTLTPHQLKSHISDAIFNFLSSLSPTLKSIGIYQRPMYGQYQDCSEKIGLDINLPYLPKLNTFKMFPGSSLPCDRYNLEETRRLPNVTNFTGSFADIFSSYFKFCNLKSINVILPEDILSDDSVFSRVFPRVTHLVLHPYNVNDDTFRKIILMFPNLQSLKIDTAMLSVGDRRFQPKVDPKSNVDPLTDSGVTGIPLHDLQL